MAQEERVVEPVTKRKVCIVGYSATSREDAPYDDESFEFWGINNLYTVVKGKKWHRWFDMHPERIIDANQKNLEEDHLAWLQQEHDFPVYMLRKFEQFPSSVAFPIQEIQGLMLSEWGFEPGEEKLFHSGVAFPLALAAYEGVDEVHIYGIDMVMEEEYAYQRPNMEMWIGVVRNLSAKSGGKIRVVVEPKCALLKGPGLYGYDHEAFEVPMRLARFFYEERATFENHVENTHAELKKRQKEIEELKAQLNTYDGCRQFADQMLGKMRRVSRGERL